MAIKLNDACIRVTCPAGHVNMLSVRDWEQIKDIDAKSDACMGNCVIHHFSVDGVDCCQTDCHFDIDAWFEVFEYPNGSCEGTECSDNVVKCDIDKAVEILPD